MLLKLRVNGFRLAISGRYRDEYLRASSEGRLFILAVFGDVWTYNIRSRRPIACYAEGSHLVRQLRVELVFWLKGAFAGDLFHREEGPRAPRQATYAHLLRRPTLGRFSFLANVATVSGLVYVLRRLFSGVGLFLGAQIVSGRFSARA